MRVLHSLFIVMTGLIGMVSLATADQDKSDNNKQTSDISRKQFNTMLGAILDTLKTDYVEDLSNRELLEGALSGMVSSLDPHSSFLSSKKYNDMRNQASGQFGGLGIEIIIEKDLIRIISPIEDTPAFRAGLKPGDQIVAVEGKPIASMTDIEALKSLRGEPGTDVNVTIFREKQSPFDVTLTREFIKVQSVKFRTEKDVGYLRIATFNDDTTSETIKAIREIRNELGPKLKGYVLDLRNNPGGLLDQAVSVSSLFLPSGRNVVSIKGRDAKKFAAFNSNSSDITQGLPLVVLVNSGSASASEIVAGALQDYKRALIVGTKTFGKGSVQRVTPVKDVGALKMTIALYYTPLGRSIQKEGIQPDIIVEQQLDLQTINSDERLREALLKDAIEDENSEKVKKIEATKPAKTTRQFSEVSDYQLHQAINILRAIGLGFNPKTEG